MHFAFALGLGVGLGVWFFSLDRWRGKKERRCAQDHHLQVDLVHGAYIRALRYGNCEDLLFLVKKAHSSIEERDTYVLQEDQEIDKEKEAWVYPHR